MCVFAHERASQTCTCTHGTICMEPVRGGESPEASDGDGELEQKEEEEEERKET